MRARLLIGTFTIPQPDLSLAILLTPQKTRVSLGCCFRFAAARDDGRRDYCPHPKTFVRSPMKFAPATSRHDWSDLDSV
jgi:hypothetical protein